MLNQDERDSKLFGLETAPSGLPPTTDRATLEPVSVFTPGTDQVAADPHDAPTRAGRSRARPSQPGTALRQRSFEERYTERRLLGRGGMGEVRLSRDHTVGREVAIKIIRPRESGPSARMQQRFIREARVQGQLEHPSIVPVYDAGVDADGSLFFTMKRVRGSSLAEVLKGLRERDSAPGERYSRRRLLSVFSRLCMAVDYAHKKGVIHRDVKPSNVMLGDFTEVYLLDWGLAALRGEPQGSLDGIHDGSGQDDLGTGTLGTPGYMAPEQVESAWRADARADVYSLGALLFEILTLKPLHHASSTSEVLASTLQLDGAHPAQRAPDRDIPPELDDLCFRATRLAPHERLASAAAMSLAIEAYLDGDRDLELRRTLAEEHGKRAAGALDEATEPEADEPELRAEAMREVTAALGLDPTHKGALSTLLRLITVAPRTVPPEAQAEMDGNQYNARRFGAKMATFFYIFLLAYLPLMLWMGVRDWWYFAMGWCLVGGCALLSRRVWQQRKPGVPWAHLLASTVTVIAASVMFGPFIMLPMLALGQTIMYITTVGGLRGIVPLAGVATFLVPLLLSWAGVIEPQVLFENDRIVVLPGVFHFNSLATQVTLVVAIVANLFGCAWAVIKLRQAYAAAERALQLQAWHLKQMVRS